MADGAAAGRGPSLHHDALPATGNHRLPAFAASTDNMVPEVNMNKLRIASAVAALTSALAFSAWGADSTSAAADGASNLDRSAQQSTTADTAQGAASSKSDAAKAADARKRTPTAAMDSATPTEKSTTDNASTKHPPTSQMDSAAPDQKLPDSAGGATTAGGGAPTALRRN